MNLAKLNSILEKFWWGIAVLTFIMIVYFSIMDGFNNWAFYYLIPALAVVMALLRRFMKNKLEKSQSFKK